MPGQTLRLQQIVPAVLCLSNTTWEASETAFPMPGREQECSHDSSYETWQLENNPKHAQFPCIDGALPFFPGLVYSHEERNCFVSPLGKLFSFNALLFHNV